MTQLRGSFDFAMKSFQRFRSFHNRRRHHFQSDRSLESFVLGLQHDAHTALSKLVEDNIVAEHKHLAFARIDLFGLILRQTFLANEFTS